MNIPWSKRQFLFHIILFIILFYLVPFSHGNFQEDNILFQQIETEYIRTIAVNPNDAIVYVNLGNLYKDYKKYSDAVEALQKAIKLDSSIVRAHYSLGVVLQTMGQAEEAVKAYERVISLDPKHINAFYNSGLAFLDLDEPDSAMEAFSFALNIDPKHTDSRLNVCNILTSKDHFELAEKCYQDVIDIKPSFTTAYLGKAGMHQMKGELDIAAELYRKVLELDRFNKLAKHALKAIERENVVEQGETNEYVEVLFDAYAKSFDKSLMDLQYRAPILIAQTLKDIWRDDTVLPKVLDLGAGTGLFCVALKQVGVLVESIFAIDISSKMIAKAREKNCYTDLYVSELESFFTNLYRLEDYANTRDVNTIVAADVFVYFGNFSNIILASVDALLTSAALGPKTILFTVEALPPALGLHAQMYTLQEAGRYAHSKTFLLSMIDSIRERYNRLITLDHSVSEVVLRKNYGEDVKGYLLKIDISRSDRSI